MIKAILYTLLALVLTVAAALGWVVYNLEALVNDYRNDLGEQASTYLGRQMRFGPVKITWDDGLGAEFREMRLAGAADATAEQANVERLFLKLDVVKMVKARGRKLEVLKAVVTRPVISLRRHEDGTWDFADILKHVTAKAQAEAEQTDKTANDYFRELQIAGLEVNDARVRIVDDQLHQNLVVEDIHIKVSTIVPGKPVWGDVTLTLDDSKSKAQLKTHLEIRPLPADLDFSDWPTVKSSIQLTNLDLATWGRLVPVDWVRPDQGKVELDITADTDPDADIAVLKGKVGVDGLQLVRGDRKGKVSDFDFQMHVDSALSEPTLTVHKLNLLGPGLSVTTHLRLEERSFEGLRDAGLDVTVEDLARLMAILPDSSGLLPPELALEGPFEVHVQGDNDEGHVVVDLDRARVAWEGAMDKGQGTRLHADVTFKKRGADVMVDPINLELDQASISGSMVVPARGRAPITGSLSTGELRLKRLRGIFPAVAKAEKDGVHVDGIVQATVAASEKDGQQVFNADLMLTRMDVNVPAAMVSGEASISVESQPDSQRRQHVEVSGDLSGLNIRLNGDDGKPRFAKRKGVSSDLTAQLIQSPKELLVEQFQLSVGQSTLEATGAMHHMDGPAPDVEVKTTQLVLDLNDVRSMVPAAKILPRDGTATAQVVVKGQPKNPPSMTVLVSEMEVVLGRNKVQGAVGVKNLADPQLVAKLDTVSLSFGELNKMLPGQGIPPRGGLTAQVVLQGRLKDTQTLSVQVDDLDANVYDITLRGRGHLENLQQPVFDLNLDADKVDVVALQKELRGGKPAPADTSPPDEKARGLPADVRQKLNGLRGRVDLEVGQVVYEKYDVRDVQAVLALSRGKLNAEKLELTLYGGRFVFTGTELRLGEEWLKEHIVLKVRGLNVGRAVDAHTNRSGKLRGYADADFDLVGRGIRGQDVMDSLNGPISISSQELDVVGLNLPGQMFSRLQESSPLPLPFPTGVEAFDPSAPTAFENFTMEGRFAAKKFVMARPMTTETEFGKLSLGGEVFMDSKLDLVGSASLQPQFVTELTNGMVTPPEAVMVPLKIGGTWSDPEVTGVDVSAFSKGMGITNIFGGAMDAAENTRSELDARLQEVQATAARMHLLSINEAKDKADRAQQDATEKAAIAKAAAQRAAASPSEVSRRAAEAARLQSEAADRVAKEAREKAARLEQGNPLADGKKKAEALAAEQMDQAARDAGRTKEALKQNAETAKRQAKELLDKMFE